MNSMRIYLLGALLFLTACAGNDIVENKQAKGSVKQDVSLSSKSTKTLEKKTVKKSNKQLNLAKSKKATKPKSLVLADVRWATRKHPKTLKVESNAVLRTKPSEANKSLLGA